MMRLFAIALCLLPAACVAGNGFDAARDAGSPIAEVPFQISEDGWIIAPVRINGAGPYDFLVDSAATVSVVYQRLADEHAFQRAPQPNIRVLGLTETRYLPAWEIGDIDVAGEVRRDHIGVVLEDWPAPLRTPHGVLGLDFLKHYVVRFDIDRQTMAFYPPGAFDAAPKLRTRDMPEYVFAADNAPLYRTRIQVKGRDIHCIVDTGSALSVVNSRALRAMLTGLFIGPASRRGLRTGSRLSDAFGSIEDAGAVDVARITLAAARWRNKRIVVFDADIFRELGVDRRPFCLLGADLLADQSFVLDFPGERIIIEQ